MIRARWWRVMNSRGSCCLPGSGRVVELDPTNGTVPKSNREVVATPERIPFRYRKMDNRFTNNRTGRGTFDGKRQRILQGMLEAVGARGYEEATVQDALDAAGLYRQ